MKRKFNIVIRKEWEFFVTRVIENNVSSFWKTKEEAIENTREALELYEEDNDFNEDLKEYKIKEPSLLEYSFT